MVKDKKVALIYRVGALMIAVTGFLTMMGVFGGGWNFSVLAFYTLQSNVLVIVLFVMLTIRTAMGLREGKSGDAGFFARFEMVCSINILLTFLVYWLLLAPRVFMMVDDFPIWTYANLAVHGFTPLLCIIDYFLFTRPGHLKYRDIYYVCIFPLVYLIGTSIAGLLGYVYFISADDGLPIRFPYFFYDFDRIGMLAFAYIGGLVVFLVAVGHAFYFLDKARKRRCQENCPTTDVTD